MAKLAALVFDERYNLLGHIETKDILHGIAAAALAGKGERQDIISAADEETLQAVKELSDRPVSTLLTPFKLFADPEDSVDRAADIMLTNNLQLLPVLENQKKLLGIVRSTEIFEYLSSRFFMA